MAQDNRGSTDLAGAVCAVTGAAQSIGLGIAEAFCREGAKVALLDINGDEAARQAERLCAEEGAARAYALDVSDQAAVRECFARIAADLGAVTVLVNNAGIVGQKPFEEITPEEMDRMMRVNVHGTLDCCQAAAEGMKTAGHGRIINVSSKSGKTGSALMAHYSAAKGAVIAMTHAMAFELAPFGITVNCLCPGITGDTGVWDHVSAAYTRNLGFSKEEVVKKFTAKIPLGRLTHIRDVVNFAVFLATRADYCTGQAFNITGGREVH
jgi:NAD(P)-dependent dehydrogenase (short-subunit alcohol dehydrogenase family)